MASKLTIKQRIEMAKANASNQLSKPSVPRNKLLKKKADPDRDTRQQVELLKSICTEHSLGDLSLTNCLFATESGEQIILENTVVWGNMRASAIVIAVKNIDEISELYDVVDLKNKKRERDQKKKEADDAAAAAELERIKNADLPVENPGHQAILKLINEKDNAEAAGTETAEDTKQEAEQTEPAELAEQPEPTDMVETDPVEQSEEKTLTRGQRKRIRALRSMNEELQKKAKMAHNKYHRNFMTKLTSKFTITPIREYFYFESKMNITKMIISDAHAYRISMPENTPHQYFLVTGDLQIKSKVMTEIDPSYDAKSQQTEYEDFMKRVEEKEKIKREYHKDDELVAEDSDDDNDDENADESKVLGMPDEGLVNLPQSQTE